MHRAKVLASAPKQSFVYVTLISPALTPRLVDPSVTQLDKHSNSPVRVRKLSITTSLTSLPTNYTLSP
jgi:hypothetical protein